MAEMKNLPPGHKAEWVAPRLVELCVDIRDVAAGLAAGTDGAEPGTPDTSAS